MFDETPVVGESALTASDLAAALRKCPAAHTDLRAYQEVREPTPREAALAMIRNNEPCSRHAVARFLVNMRGTSQEAAFAAIKELIHDREVIEVDGDLMTAKGEPQDPMRWPLVVAVFLASFWSALAILLWLVLK